MPAVFDAAARGNFYYWLTGSKSKFGVAIIPKEDFLTSMQASMLRILVKDQRAATTFYYPAMRLSTLIERYKTTEKNPDKLPPGDLESFLIRT